MRRPRRMLALALAAFAASSLGACGRLNRTVTLRGDSAVRIHLPAAYRW